MRILLLTHYYSPEIGAPQRRWREIVARLVARGHQVAVCAPMPHYPRSRMRDLDLVAPSQPCWRWSEGEIGERILRLPYLPSSSSMLRQLSDQAFSSVCAVAASGWLRAAKPDVVISTLPGLPAPFAGEAASRLLDVPHIIEVRDAWPDLIADSHLVSGLCRGVIPSRIAAALENRVLPEVFNAAFRRAAAVVTTTEGFADRIRRRGVERVTCVRNSSLAGMRPGSRFLESVGGELHLLYVGTVGRSQDLSTVVSAVSQVENVRLRIVGEGAALAPLKAQAALESRIEFFPQTTGPALEAHWDWAHSAVVSLAPLDSFTVTVPSKLYSVMSKGIHVLGVLAGEAASIVESSGAGTVVEPGDAAKLAQALTFLLDNPAVLAVGDAPSDWLSAYASPDGMADAYEALLSEVVR